MDISVKQLKCLNASLQAEIDKLRSQVKKLREALESCKRISERAELTTNKRSRSVYRTIGVDIDRIAKQALAETEGE